MKPLLIALLLALACATGGAASVDQHADKLASLGPYRGDELSVDHIIPRAVVPELDNVIANLELMPLRMNESKNAKVGERQLALADKLRAAGLLSRKGLQKVKTAIANHR